MTRTNKATRFIHAGHPRLLSSRSRCGQILYRSPSRQGLLNRMEHVDSTCSVRLRRRLLVVALNWGCRGPEHLISLILIFVLYLNIGMLNGHLYNAVLYDPARLYIIHGHFLLLYP